MFQSIWDAIVAHRIWAAVVAGLITAAVIAIIKAFRRSTKQPASNQINVSNTNQSGGQSVQIGKVTGDNNSEQR